MLEFLPVLAVGSVTLVSSPIGPGSRLGLGLRLGPDAPVTAVPGVLVLAGPALVDLSGEPVFQQITVCVQILSVYLGCSTLQGCIFHRCYLRLCHSRFHYLALQQNIPPCQVRQGRPLQGRSLKAPPQGALLGPEGPRYPALEGRLPTPPEFPGLRYLPLCLQQGGLRVGYAERKTNLMRLSRALAHLPQQSCCLKSECVPYRSSTL